MNIAQAMRALRSLYGTRAGYRRDERAPKREERERISAALADLLASALQARAAAELRKRELLQDDRYLDLLSAAREAEGAHRAAQSKCNHYRVVVGKTNGSFFEVTGQGDNWAEAIEAARARKSDPNYEEICAMRDKR